MQRMALVMALLQLTGALAGLQILCPCPAPPPEAEPLPPPELPPDTRGNTRD